MLCFFCVDIEAQNAGVPERGGAESHDYVDLGLPSGTLWATCNVGANSPEEYGDYFSWGETKPKNTYNWVTYKWSKGTSTTMTKYCTDSNYGIIDNKEELDSSDDAATVNWGSAWRMPTYEQQIELFEHCTWTWTTVNGINGHSVVGPNGKSIFLPAAGYRDDVDREGGEGIRGYYWASSLLLSYPDSACNWGFGEGGYVGESFFRFCGLPVRPVCASAE